MFPENTIEKKYKNVVRNKEETDYTVLIFKKMKRGTRQLKIILKRRIFGREFTLDQNGDEIKNYEFAILIRSEDYDKIVSSTHDEKQLSTSFSITTW